jgi:hypothetical protein
VDTGSPLSVIPQYIWSQFRAGAVTPLAFDPAMTPIQRRTIIAGGRYPFELGELDVELFDYDRHTMVVRIVAQFTRDGGTLVTPMILGLRGGAIDGRILHAEPDPAAPFGQAWFLEDP